MDKHRRLKAVELSLTPHEFVLLWTKNAVKGTFEDGARQSPRPRQAIENSIATIVGAGLKGQPEALVERAILQARQEADSLYMLVIEVNVAVQQSMIEREREYIFLLGYVGALLRGGATPGVEKIFRALTLLFANEILRVEDAVSQISAEKFGGQTILFSDSVATLEKQRVLAREALGYFNALAHELNFPELTVEAIRDGLRPRVDQQVSSWVSLARIGMLAMLGGEGDFRTAFDHFIREHRPRDAGPVGG